jgi:hypothetical protein
MKDHLNIIGMLKRRNIDLESYRHVIIAFYSMKKLSNIYSCNAIL